MNEPNNLVYRGQTRPPTHTHTYTCNTHAAELEMTDINMHQPPLLHTHAHTALMGYLPVIRQWLVGFFMVGYSRVGGGVFFLLEDKQPATCAPP